MEELARDTLNSDMFKGVVDSGTEVLNFLLALEDSIGIVNALLLIAMPKAISATAGAITKLATSTNLAMSATGGFTLAITAIIGVLGLVQSHYRKVNEEISKQKTFLQETTIAWRELNEEQRKNARLEAQDVINRLSGQYENAQTELKIYTRQISEHNKAIRDLQAQLGAGEAQDKRTEDAIARRQAKIDRLEESMVKYENIVKAVDEAHSVLALDMNAISEQFEGMGGILDQTAEDWQNFKDNLEIPPEAMLSFEEFQEQFKQMSSDFEFMSDAQKQATIEFVRNQLVQTSTLANAVAERLGLYKLEAEGLYEAGIRDLPLGSEEYEQLIIQVNKLSDQYHELLAPVETVSTSTKKVTKELTEQEKAIQRLSSELKILEIQESLATDDIDRQNELRQSQIDKLKELQSWVEQGSLEWYQYQQQIASVSQEISDSLVKSVEDTNKQLEEQNKLLSEQVEAYENEVKQALENQINSLESARDAQLELAEASIASKEEEIKLLQEKNKAQEEEAKKAKIVLDLEKAKLKLKNLEQERNVRVFRAGQGFVFESDPRAIKAQREEIAKINQQLLDHDVDVNKKAEEQKLKNQLDTLKKEKDAIKKSYDDRLKAIKNTMDSISDVTGSELSKQSSLWQRWAETNSKVLESFGNNIDTLISKIIKLNAQQTENVGTIAENKASIGDYTGYKLDKAQQKSLAVINDPNASAEDKKAHKKWLDSTLANTPKLNTGGATMADGYAMLHQNEVVTNPTQTANLLSMAGVQLGSAMQNARNLYSLSNMPKIAPTMSGGGGETIIQNLNVNLDNVTDVQGFVNEVQNIKRYFNNKSR